jgi:hypothetical protein
MVWEPGMNTQETRYSLTDRIKEIKQLPDELK